MSGIEPYYKKKFRSRKYRLDPADNFKLDKIRGEDGPEEGQRRKLNVWAALAISIGILLVAFILPRLVNTVVTRRHTDALVNLGRVQKAMGEEANTFSEKTVFVVKQSDKYYLFWYEPGANISAGKYGRSYYDFAEINNPGSYIMPINIAEGKELEYPFESVPISEEKGKVKLMDGLQVLDGYMIKKLRVDLENIPKNVDIYQFVKVG